MLNKTFLAIFNHCVFDRGEEKESEEFIRTHNHRIRSILRYRGSPAALSPINVDDYYDPEGRIWFMVSSSIVANDSCLPLGVPFRERIGSQSQASKTWGSFSFKSPICLMSFPDRADEAQTKIPIHSLPHFPLISKVMQKKGYNSSNCHWSEPLENVIGKRCRTFWWR